MSFGQGNQNPSGGSSSGPKVYRALLSQSGTNDPTAIVLENTLGGEVVWTRNGAGNYSGTGLFTGAVPSRRWLLSKGVGDGLYTATLEKSSGAEVALNTGDYDNGNADDLLIQELVEILVYP